MNVCDMKNLVEYAKDYDIEGTNDYGEFVSTYIGRSCIDIAFSNFMYVIIENDRDKESGKEYMIRVYDWNKWLRNDVVDGGYIYCDNELDILAACELIRMV